MKIIGITGGTGFVGGQLAALLVAEGYEVIIFTRGAKNSKGNIRYAHWDPEKQECDKASLAQVEAMVNLAGAGIADKRWSDERKKEILRSRVDGTNFLVAQLQAHAPLCQTFIGASATGFYGPDRPLAIPFREEAQAYHDFLGEVCRLWEAAQMMSAPFCRTVIFRFGIVLGRQGGGYPKLAQPMSFGIVPILCGGQQMVSWIHVTDLVQMISAALKEDKYRGIYNAVAPVPVSHKTMMKTIAQAKGGIKISVPVPGFILNLIMGEASVEVLKSCTASADKILEEGFTFQYETMERAAKELTEKSFPTKRRASRQKAE